MTDTPLIDRSTGALLVALTVLMALSDWTALAWADDAAAALAVLALALMAPRVRRGRQVFVVVGLVLAAAAVATRGDWLGALDRALQSAAFIAAFFTALTTLRHAAETSPAIRACGRFLASQPPGRRYAALTVGGQLFALLLNYGAIALLGSLAMASAREEKNAEIREIRTRRMLLAIQRGFVATLPWSPLAFSIAITTVLIPGASWAAAVPQCLVSAAILAGLGWALDTAFKPKLSGPRPPRVPPEGTWASVTPLLTLLAVLMVSVAVLHLATGVRVVGIVIVVVPVMSAVWVWRQDGVVRMGRRAAAYATRDILSYRSELVLLMMAGFIGTLGSALAAPLIENWGVDLAGIPAWLLLVAMVWIVPLTGQLGMNPILSVSVLAPILPSAAAIGVEPSDIVVAITSGWALSGASSPFTATTLMVGSFGGISAARVGIVWNGVYAVLAGVLLSAWVAIGALT